MRNYTHNIAHLIPHRPTNVFVYVCASHLYGSNALNVVSNGSVLAEECYL